MVTDDMVALVPQLHTFARSLCRDGVRADDLVQEALMRAINNIQRFKPGTNLKAWLFTIVRNEHYSQLRRGKFEAQGMDIELLPEPRDRKSTRLNSSHSSISYAVFCLKKKKKMYKSQDHKERSVNNSVLRLHE